MFLATTGILARGGTPSGPPIITTNLLMHLDAGNAASYQGTGTTWTDLTGNAYNGTLNNGVAYSTSNGGVLIYDGVDDYAIVSSHTKSALVNPTGKFTLQFWVYISGSQSSVGVFQMANNLSSGEPWLLLQRQTNTSIRWFLNGGFRITQTITTNTWYNLALSYDGTIWRVYIDGVQSSTYTGAIGTLNATSLVLANGFSGYLNGRMPHILSYTTNLSAAQILQNYNALKPRY